MFIWGLRTRLGDHLQEQQQLQLQQLAQMTAAARLPSRADDSEAATGKLLGSCVQPLHGPVPWRCRS